jgi:hypothetical protein
LETRIRNNKDTYCCSWFQVVIEIIEVPANTCWKTLVCWIENIVEYSVPLGKKFEYNHLTATHSDIQLQNHPQNITRHKTSSSSASQTLITKNIFIRKTLQFIPSPNHIQYPPETMVCTRRFTDFTGILGSGKPSQASQQSEPVTVQMLR